MRSVLIWTAACLLTNAHACVGLPNTRLAFVRAKTGEAVDLGGVLSEYLNRVSLRSFPDDGAGCIFALVWLNEDAVVRFNGLNAGLDANAQLLSDLLRENPTFQALRSARPDELLYLKHLPPR